MPRPLLSSRDQCQSPSVQQACIQGNLFLAISFFSKLTVFLSIAKHLLHFFGSTTSHVKKKTRKILRYCEFATRVCVCVCKIISVCTSVCIVYLSLPGSCTCGCKVEDRDGSKLPCRAETGSSEPTCPRPGAGGVPSRPRSSTPGLAKQMPLNRGGRAPSPAHLFRTPPSLEGVLVCLPHLFP